MKSLLVAILMVCPLLFFGQDADKLLREVRAKMDVVKDYRATGKLKTDVAFLKIPVSGIQVFFKKPDKFRLKKDGGISLLPKNGVSINLGNLLLADHYTAVPAGESTIEGQKLQVIKLLPLDDNNQIVLSTLYIDPTQLLIRKAITTTRENGTYDMLMYYGKYAQYGLPDKVIFSFNTKDYKMPKGITFEYEPGENRNQQLEKTKDKKGRVEILYHEYFINKGVPDNVFN